MGKEVWNLAHQDLKANMFSFLSLFQPEQIASQLFDSNELNKSCKQQQHLYKSQSFLSHILPFVFCFFNFDPWQS